MDGREHHRFHSTRISRGWYDADERVIELEFTDGVHWLYRRVPRRVWDALKRASSAGRFLAQVLDGYPNGSA